MTDQKSLTIYVQIQRDSALNDISGDNRRSGPTFIRQCLPLSSASIIKVKNFFFRHASFLFSWSSPYRRWKKQQDYLHKIYNNLRQSDDTRHKLIMLVTHNCDLSGAPLLLLAIGRELHSMGFSLNILSLGGGRLIEEFAQLGNILNAELYGQKEVERFLNSLATTGLKNVIVNTVVSGSVIPLLKQRGFRVVSLIHELPGIIHGLKQEVNADIVARLSDRVVFAADMVCQCFCKIAPIDAEKIRIRPQGVLHPNPYRNNYAEARRIIREKHGLPDDASIVLGVGTTVARKGYDFFIEIGATIVRKNPNVFFIWIGDCYDPDVGVGIKACIQDLGLQTRILFPGFKRDLDAYFAGATVYALTSREDPFPNVVLQSLDAGTPIVAFEGATGAGDLIGAHGGALAKAFEVEDFADKLNALLAIQVRIQSRKISSVGEYTRDLLSYLNT